jgi:hypothetical protein
MAWTTPLTAVSNATLTAAQWNASVRDNLAETAPAKATTPGSIFVTSAANTIVERIPQTALVGGSDTVAATSYANTTTPGPAVTATSAAKAMIFTSGWMALGSASNSVYMAHQISGATSIAAADTWALEHRGSNGTNDIINATRAHLETALNSGSNTYTVMYRVSGGAAATVQRRHLTVIPF